jgi:DNA-binding transcriptional MerR regulator
MTPASAPRQWKIGELAARAGVTPRTLRHYDAIGLLRPSARTPAGYRLYTAADVERLQTIRSLQSMGFSLETAAEALRRPDFTPLRVLEMQLASMGEQLRRQRTLVENLEGLLRLLRTTGKASPEDFLNAIEAMREAESLYTSEEREAIRRRSEELGKERMLQVEAEWPRLMAAMTAAMENGADPAGAEVRPLARRWKELVEMFTGGNPAIAVKLKRLYAESPKARAAFGGPDPRLTAYVEKAMRALPEETL